jgi:flavoprotein hydroxylase
MCTGLQDAAALAWRLDLVLTGYASAGLLDSYGEERAAQAERAIRASVALGKVICVVDEDAARDRDAAMLARPAKRTGPDPAVALTSGLVHRVDGAAARGAGAVFPQGRVTADGRTGLLEDVLRATHGTGFLLVTDGTTDDRAVPALSHLPMRTVPLGPVVDLDGVYRSTLEAAGANAILVRPDHHVFGTARSAAELSDLETQLHQALRAS